MSALSPSVSTTTTNVQPTFYRQSGDIAAFVGVFEKGPINTPILITSAIQFKETFGRATESNFNDWYQVYNFLQYSSAIWVCRSCGDYTFNASSSGALPFLINNKEEFDENYANIGIKNSEYFTFIARTPGDWGNLLSIAIVTKIEFDTNVEVYKGTRARDIFSFFEDEYFGLIVFRNGKPMESFYKKFDEVDEINQESRYIYVKRRVESLRNAYYDANYENFNGNFYYINGSLEFIDGNYDLSAEGNLFLNDGSYHYIDGNEAQELIRSYYGDYIIHLTGGADSYPSYVLFEESHQIFEHTENYDIDIIIGNDIENKLAVNVANNRKDCIAFIGIPAIYLEFLEAIHLGFKHIVHTDKHQEIAVTKKLWGVKTTSEVLSRIKDYIDTIPVSEFTHFTLNSKLQYDNFTNKSKPMNIAGDIAGLKAQASYKTPWTPHAGMENGLIKNMEKLFLIYNDKQKKEFYKKGLNFVENGRLMSQRTFTTRPTSFNRVHIRSLFNYVEKTVQKNLRFYLFNENTRPLRGRITSEIKRFLEDVKASRGIDWGRVEVHPDKKDPNGIIIDVYIKPIYVAEYIQLRMNNVGTNTISQILNSSL